jgi:hypothetical protein
MHLEQRLKASSNLASVASFSPVQRIMIRAKAYELRAEPGDGPGVRLRKLPRIRKPK